MHNTPRNVNDYCVLNSLKIIGNSFKNEGRLTWHHLVILGKVKTANLQKFYLANKLVLYTFISR